MNKIITYNEYVAWMTAMNVKPFTEAKWNTTSETIKFGMSLSARRWQRRNA